MRMPVEDAAKWLLESLDAPRGAVNTMAFREKDRAYIRVLVDPLYQPRLRPVPKTFKGYSVKVERRNPTIAQSSSLLE